MSTVLTDLVRQMGPDVEPSSELFDQSWDALRGLLAAEMKRRSNWASPPRFLGVVGHGSWVTAPSPGSDALDELAAECFEFVFVRRLGGLRDQATRKTNVDGLVALAIRHFLLEAQRRNDPLGFRLFEVLRRVVKQGLEGGSLVLLAGDPRVRNDSWIGLPDRPAALQPGLHLEEMGALADAWVQRHLDGLVSAAYGELNRLCALLEDELTDHLQAYGALRFGDLAARLKERGRAAWATRWLGTPFDASKGSSPAAEPFDGFGSVTECVDRGIAAFDGRVKARRYLERLWEFLRAFAGDPEVDRAELGWDGLQWMDEDLRPPNRELSKILQIPRERIPQLLEILGGYWSECRQDPDAFSIKSSTQPSIEGSTVSSKDSQPSIQSAKARARASLGAFEKPPIVKLLPPRLPEPGDLCVFPGSEVDGTWWLMQTAGDGLLAVPVDTCPLLGPDDRVMEIADFGGELTLRPALGLRSLTWPPTVVVARLSTEESRRIEDGLELDGRAVMEDDLPALEEWLRDGPRIARQRLEAAIGAQVLGKSSPKNETSHIRPPGPSRIWPALAAVLAVTLLGLGLRLGMLQQTLDELRRPLVNVPYDGLKFDLTPRGPGRLVVPDGADAFQIDFDVPVELERIRIVLLDGEGRELRATEELEGGGTVTWLLWLSTLPGPPWEFQLQVREGDRWQTVDQEKIPYWSPDEDL